MNERLDYLDSSRGLAALSVVLTHFFGAYGIFSILKPYDHTILHILWHGSGAVNYFFVLSGFVLSRNLLKNISGPYKLNLSGYIIRRCFRIFPLYLACLWLSFCFLNLYLDYQDLIIYPTKSAWISQFWAAPKTLFSMLKESLLIFNVGDEAERLVPQDWTLSTELIYSSLLPIFCVLIIRGNSWQLTLLFFMLWIKQFIFIPFALGALIAYHHEIIISSLKKRSQYFALPLIVIGILLYTANYNFLYPIMNGHKIRVMIFESFGAAIIIIGIMESSLMKNVLSTRILVFIGRISYGIYLTHFLILIFFVPKILLVLSFNTTLETSKFMALLFLMGATTIVSYLLNEVVEKPFNRLGKSLSKKFNPEFSLQKKLKSAISEKTSSRIIN